MAPFGDSTCFDGVVVESIVSLSPVLDGFTSVIIMVVVSLGPVVDGSKSVVGVVV